MLKKLLTPNEDSGYSLIIGEHGTGKTSLIRSAISEMKIPTGIAYVLIPNTTDVNTNHTVIIKAIQNAAGWASDPVLNSGNCK
jgi:ABC-type phosphate/phosphonate transport system ATPase subunit